jgi:hypothetical protein
MSRSSSITKNPLSTESILDRFDFPTSSILSEITCSQERDRRKAEIEAILNPKPPQSQQIFVAPVPDLPRRIRMLHELRRWQEWVAEKYRRFKHGSY